VSTEREVKLDVPDRFEMPDLALAAGVEIHDGGTATYDTAWFDTADLRLARWGTSLRFRDGEGWTLKLDPTSSDGMLSREELPFEGAAGEVPEAAADLVRGLARGEPLAERVRATTTRRRLEVGPDERPLVEVVDDAVEVTDAPSGAARFRQIEVEIRAEEGEPVARALVDALRASGAPEDPGTPKIDRALGGRPPSEFDVPDVGRTSTIGDLIRAAIAAPVHALIAHDPGVRLGTEPEHVHKARVATRRLRSDLRTFSAWLDAEWADDLRAELGWLADDLGSVRDADVMLGRLRDEVERLPADDREAATGLVERLARVGDEAAERLRRAMGSERYLRLLDRLVVAARDPALRGDTDASAATAGGVMQRQWAKLRRAVDRIEEPARPDALHRIRIRAKRARYAAEAVQPAFGGRAKPFVRDAVELQDVLGEHHDAIVLESWLRDAAASAGARQAFVAGELAAGERRAADLAAATWREAWRSLARKRNLFWT
jgi:CHAD domain-containing protein